MLADNFTDNLIIYIYFFQNFNTLQSVCIGMDTRVPAQLPIKLHVGIHIHHKLQLYLQIYLIALAKTCPLC